MVFRRLHHGEVLVGRDRERAIIDRALAAARAGRGSALQVLGEPGIGKSALLADGARRASGFTVLGAAGAPGEEDLAFGALADLLRPVVHLAGRVPDPQRGALLAALALGPPAPGDRLAAYAGTLALLGEAAAAGPVLVLVDDLQVVDEPSRQALAFCCRRIADDAVVILGAARADGGPLPLGAAPTIHLGPLPDGSARELLRDAPGGSELAPSVARRLLRAAGGNPLALQELPGLLTRGQRDGSQPLDEPLRPGQAVLRAFRGRIESLAPEGRTAVLIVACASDPALTGILSALRCAGLGPAALEAAEEGGVLRIEPERVVFRHPLLRGVADDLAGGPARRQAHAVLAEALDPAAEPERWAWHRAEAVIGPDPEVARAPAAAGDEAAGRGGFGSAATAYLRAARLSILREDRAERMVAAAGSALAAGHTAWACELVRGAWSEGPEAALRTRADLIMGQAMVTSGDVAEVTEFLVRAAAVATDAESRTLMPALASFGALMRDDPPGALAIARRSLTAAADAGTAEARLVAEGALTVSAALSGRVRYVRSTQDVIRADAAASPITPMPMIAAATAALGLSWAEADDAARDVLEGAIAALRRAGNAGGLVVPLAHAAQMAWRRGRWAEAMSHAEEAVGLGEEAGQVVATAFALANRAIVHASAGRGEECSVDARRAQALADRTGASAVGVHVAYAEGLAALGAGDPDAARGHLRPLDGRRHGYGVGDAVSIPWRSDLVEALVRLGDPRGARALVRSLAEAAPRTGAPTALALLARCRALVDPGDAWEPRFREALLHHASGTMPFEAARTALLYGERLRRERRRGEARVHLGRALEAFEAMGAEPWAARARAELDASGMRSRRRASPAADRLTPRELQVALAVADGSTNREVAARLFLSQKTVERHLGNVYRKLGLRSRSQLARWFASGADAGREA